ncbi:uncharacterized protein [Cicer arietinum]|uniref:Uncharacterized protein LOC105852414 n=1 Tax=Cicer arietinum TaxID=3827 RepID=A0A1S3EDL7_CICAR|nr:uncharacterized protein LOC105852414 [Cicer arietinum]
MRLEKTTSNRRVGRMKAYMKKYDIVGQRIFRAKVCEVVFPHTTSILAPPEKIIDVVANGNYGFHAIAALLGWIEESWPLVQSQLDKEIRLHQDLYSNVFYDSVQSVCNSLKISGLGAQGKNKWASLPNLGYVIATLYNVILVSLPRNLNMTFFPLNKASSKESSVHSLLAIGFVNENHWVQIN